MTPPQPSRLFKATQNTSLSKITFEEVDLCMATSSSEATPKALEATTEANRSNSQVGMSFELSTLLYTLPDPSQNLAIQAYDQFSLFPRLPVELRLKIWRLTFPRRLVTDDNLRSLYCASNHLPKAAYVNLESRTITLKDYILFHFQPLHIREFAMGRPKMLVWKKDDVLRIRVCLTKLTILRAWDLIFEEPFEALAKKIAYLQIEVALWKLDRLRTSLSINMEQAITDLLSCLWNKHKDTTISTAEIESGHILKEVDIIIRPSDFAPGAQVEKPSQELLDIVSHLFEDRVERGLSKKTPIIKIRTVY